MIRGRLSFWKPLRAERSVSDLYSTTTAPIRYFRLPEGPRPAGDLVLAALNGETVSVDFDWVAPYEISREDARPHLEAAVRRGVSRLGAAFGQIFEAARRVGLEETGKDLAVELAQARDNARPHLDRLETDAEQAMGQLRENLSAHTSTLFASLTAIGREAAKALDTPEGQAAMRAFGEKLSHIGEE